MSEAIVHIPVEPAEPPPLFTVVRRGYDPAAVDEYVVRTEQELAELRWQQEALDAERQRLAQERRAFAERVESWQPSFAALGAHAEASARRVEREGAEQRERVRHVWVAVEQYVQQRRAVLDRELADLRRDAELAAASLVAKARAQADDIRAAARRESQLLLERQREVEQQAHGVLVTAEQQADDVRASAQREAAEIVELAREEADRLVRQRQDVVDDLLRAHDRLHRVIGDLHEAT